MRYLGIDYGSVRIGLAFSDESETIAYPLSVIKNSPQAVEDVADVCSEKGIAGIVIGESKNFKMEDNSVMEDIKKFSESLRLKTSLPIFVHPEFMTSQQAERSMGKGAELDASAAAIILQSYLDTKNNNK